MVTMLGLTVADAVGVKLLKSPIPGGIEMVGFLGVVVAAFAIGYTKIMGGHIQVEFFIMRLPRRAQAIVTAFVSFLGLVLFALLVWQSFEYGRVLQMSGEVSMTQKIPFYPFVYAIALASIPVCLALLVEFMKSLLKAVGK